MKTTVCILSVALACGAASAFQAKQARQAKRPVDYANPLVGTAPLDDPKLIGNAPPPGEELYTGMTIPGAALPHGSMSLSPINKNLDLSYYAGVGMSYNYIHHTMLGFSAGERGMTVMPVVGDFTIPPERTAAFYSKNKEKASPGYYTVYFDDYRLKAEMTVTERTGIFRFTFPKTSQARVVVDLGRGGGNPEIVGDHSFRSCGGVGGAGRAGRAGATGGARGRGAGGGPGRAGGGGAGCTVAEFSKPFSSFGVFHQGQAVLGRSLLGDSVVSPGVRTDSGPYAGAYLEFATAQGEEVLVKVTQSDSYESAQRLLETESPGWNFDGVRKKAEAAWARRLDTIEVKGGAEKQRTLFYSLFYHSFASPRLSTHKGETYRGRGGQMETATHDRYGAVPFWDTGRNQIVLLTMVEPDVKLDILASTLDSAKESGYVPTSFHGDHGVFMFLGDWQRGLKFDWEGAYEYLRKNATDIKGPRRNFEEYLQKGWVSDFIPDVDPSPPYSLGNAGVAKTLEYSWDDYCMATYAKKLGKEDDYQMFLKRASNYKNVFDASIGFMRGRTANGQWISPFDPREPYYNFMMKEASGWGTLWLVPHDVQGLINLLGGRDKFNAKLDEFFTTPYNPKGNCRDCTGVIGQYVQGNQPDQQTAYYYDWGGQPWKTQELVRRILRDMYGSDKYGLAHPGMDDQGSTSSWYVMSAMGFYPVDPARSEYIIGSPIFDEVTIHMGPGKDFVIVANNNSEKNLYIQSATLNGKPLNKPWFSHADIANSGRLVFQMGPAPNKSWGSAPDAAPPSMSAPQ
jgi:putative alpha-1,2-mannosidase